jgi:hypothetical protein
VDAAVLEGQFSMKALRPTLSVRPWFPSELKSGIDLPATGQPAAWKTVLPV